MPNENAGPAEPPPGQVSRLIGLYQTLLRRYLEHFFPDVVLEPGSDRSFINLEVGANQATYKVSDEPDGLGVEVEWFRTRYLLLPGSPKPFLPSELRMIEMIVRVLDRRFRAMFDVGIADRAELFHYAIEDFIVTDYINPPGSIRMPTALDALRVAALSTYENRRVSTGLILLGTQRDPAVPDRTNLPGAPRYNVRLSALKSFHRICDGMHTVFLVDLHGDLAWAADIHRWASQVQGPEPLAVPCPRLYTSHAKATRNGGHVCVVLTPAQEIKVFAGGTMALAFSDGRWRLLDIPTKYAAWKQAVGASHPPDLASRLFRASLNLAERREGALFVVLRDPARSLPQLVAPNDRIIAETAMDETPDPENLSPRMAKRVLHHLVWGQHIGDLDDSVLESLASIDGAVVTDPSGRLHSFGAILRISPETLMAARAIEGARTAAALTASFHGPVLKVSEDGLLTMFLGGRRVWEL
jgi:DNA integrity scanning protein DisA with diadenylate cyclase activity